MREQFDTFSQRMSEISDVPLERYGTNASMSEYPADTQSAPQAAPTMPNKMPWRGMDEAGADTAAREPGMDAMPMQHDLHSTTKFHQLGGVYESYSSSDPDDGKNLDS